MKRAERLHALSETLRRSGSRGSTAERLAEEFGVSIRTIKRDIDSLENSGLPIWSRTGPGGGYGVSDRSSLPPISLTPAQAVALLAAVLAAPDAPLSNLGSAGVRKIMHVLDPETRSNVDEVRKRGWGNRPPPTITQTKS